MAMRAKAEINLTGDKSISHRALMLAAISDGRCEIGNISDGLDVLSTMSCLKALGVDIYIENANTRVEGVGFGKFREPADKLDCGNSGTTLRLLAGLLSASNAEIILDGDESLRKRPMRRVIDPLRNMGADIGVLSEDNCCPLQVRGHKLKAISQKLLVPSAQVKSAILLAGLSADGDTKLEESLLTRDHTERMLSHLGVKIKADRGLITLKPPDCIPAFEMQVPGDPSSAAYPIVAASLIPRLELVIKNILLNPTRIGYVRILRAMGAEIVSENCSERFNEPVGDLVVKSSNLKSIETEEKNAPSFIDEAPILALAATQARGTSIFRGLKELRVKESDRLSNTMAIINKMGGNARAEGDDIIIEGPTTLEYYDGDCFGDHRLAMMIETGNIIANGEMSAKYRKIIDISFREFYEIMEGVFI